MQTATAAKTTAIAQRRDYILSNQAQVQHLLEYDEFTYGTKILEAGIQYILIVIPEDQEIARSLEGSRIFWNWWKNQWANRDENFIIEMQDIRGLRRRRDLYDMLNNPLVLASTTSHYGKLLTDSYCRMIGEFNKRLGDLTMVAGDE